MAATSGAADRSRGQDLGPAVDGDDRPPTRSPRGARQEIDRDVGAAGPDVEQGQLGAMGGQRLDGRCGQARAAEPAIDPAQVAQVAGQRGRIVERAVEQLDGVGAALHSRRVPARLA